MEALAHPGIGLVYDGKKTIYFTDLVHVWKLDITTGEPEIFLENIHTHELYLDPQGHLYGEHYWYVESEGKFKNYIWKADEKGILTKIIEDRYDENNDFSFVRNNRFESFEIRKTADNYEIIKSDSVTETVLHQAKLKHPTWKYLTKKEELLFIDYPSLYLANSSDMVLLESDISSSRFPFSLQSENHSIYGVWTDQNENIYVALYGGRQVIKIDKEGYMNRILTSSFLWSPVNGVFDKNEDLWLMECRIGGEIRVRKIEQSELNKKASFLKENLFFLLASMGIILLLYRKFK